MPPREASNPYRDPLPKRDPPSAFRAWEKLEDAFWRAQQYGERGAAAVEFRWRYEAWQKDGWKIPDWSSGASPELQPGKDGNPGWGNDYGPLGGAGPHGQPVRGEGKEGYGDDYAPLGAAGEGEEPSSGQRDYGEDYMPLGGSGAGDDSGEGEGDEGMPDPDGGGGRGRRLPEGVRIRRGWAAYDPEGGGGGEGGPSGLRNPRGPRSYDPDGDWSLRPTSAHGGATVRPRRPEGPAVRTPNPDGDEGPIGPAFGPHGHRLAGSVLAALHGRSPSHR